MQTKNIVGLDCGNSSFRVVLGTYDGVRLTTKVIKQIPNKMVRVGDYYYWDILHIYDGFLSILQEMILTGIRIDSIGVCTWGVDFALFDAKGNMISNPLSYRNEQGIKYLGKLDDDEQCKLFERVGIACNRINSVYLMQAIRDEMPEIFSIADKILMVPDIINYFLTGEKINEPSELSTTQLMNVKNREIDAAVCELFNIPIDLFCQTGIHGTQIGNVLTSVLEQIGADYDIPVICVPSHDTASAVAAIPSQEDDFVFISSGTWSLIGTEIQEPIINRNVLEHGLTNELGAFNKITLLKNSAGMFIIQKLKREYEIESGSQWGWDDLDILEESYTLPAPIIDINDNRFFNPSNMSEEIWESLLETDQVSGQKDWNAIIKACYHSMACCYTETIANIEEITGKSYNKIYIVGGGSKNIKVNQLTANYSGKSVIACDKESTALGNIATQLAYFDDSIRLNEIREIINTSTQTKVYLSEEEIDRNPLQQYRKLTKRNKGKR